MCDFTRQHCCFHSWALSCIWNESKTREALIRSFTVPQIQLTSLTQVHTSVCTVSQSPPHLLCHSLYLGSSHHHCHPRETNSDCCSTPSWHVGQGRWSSFRSLAATSPCCRCPLMLPLNISSTRLVSQPGSQTELGTTSENLLELFCTFCDNSIPIFWDLNFSLVTINNIWCHMGMITQDPRRCKRFLLFSDVSSLI